MKRNELLLWAAGLFDGCGRIEIRPETGPTGKPYHSITIVFDLSDEITHQRLTAVNANGSVIGATWEISGYAAVKGFLKQVWPYLTPMSRGMANAKIRAYKKHRINDGA